MVIFMPYYRQHGIVHSHLRGRSSTGQNNSHTATPIEISVCKFASSILCRFTFSLFLFAIALFLFQLSINNISNKKDGSNIIAAILLTIAIVSFFRSCQTLRRYLTIMHTRRRLIQRLRERQQAYDLSVASNAGSGAAAESDLVMGDNTDLPSYKELFPSHPDISRPGLDPSSTLSPPSYDDFVKTLVFRQPTASTTTTTTLPLSSVRPHALSLPTSSLSTTPPTTDPTTTTSTTTTTTSPSRLIWITDRTRRPVCLRGTVTYV